MPHSIHQLANHVFAKLGEYCNPRQSEVLETYRFWNHEWDTDEPCDSFLTDLRIKAESCNYEEKERMIRDKIVLTVSGQLQELLLREDKLDLKKTIAVCRAYEQSNKHMKEIRDGAESKIHHLNHRQYKHKQSFSIPTRQTLQSQSHKSGKAKATAMKTDPECNFCGYKHPQSKRKVSSVG